MYRDLVVTECTSSMLVAALHDIALPEIESVFSGRQPIEGDQILVAWHGGEPVGYIAVSTPMVGEVDIWEHGVVPSRRQQGVGVALLRELAKRVPSSAILLVDPAGQLDPARMADYYGQRGFVRQDRENMWATATDVLQATVGVESDESGRDPDTAGDILRSKHSRLVSTLR